ncbi:MAG: hypothetical protein ABI824_14695 [Acidobacteriota bacterium]
MNKRFLNMLAPAAALGVAILLMQLPANSQAPASGAKATKADPTAPAGTDRADPATGAAKGKGKGKAAITGPTPRQANGKVDLTGIWSGGGPVGDLAAGLAAGETLPLLPEAKALMDKRQSQDDPEANCLPTGVPRIAPYPWRIVQDDSHIYFLFEGNIHTFRQIFTDGRAHPSAKDLDPTWFGHSTGTWEGDTFVVDTIGYNDLFWFDFKGTPHTEKLHTIERYTRTDLGTLQNDVTIIDPGAYSKPFTLHFTARLQPKGEELMEYICQENNQDVKHINGPASL